MTCSCIFDPNNTLANSDLKECEICLSGEDEVSGSIFLKREQYEFLKQALNTDNWCNKQESGLYTPAIYISSEAYD